MAFCCCRSGIEDDVQSELRVLREADEVRVLLRPRAMRRQTMQRLPASGRCLEGPSHSSGTQINWSH